MLRLGAAHRAGWWILVALAAACGGGGSGGSGPGSGPPLPAVTFSPSSFDFTADLPWSPRPASQTLTGRLGAPLTASGTLYVRLELAEGKAVTCSSATIVDETTAIAGVVPAAPATLAPGLYRDTLTVRVCLDDPTCARNELPGSPRTFPITYAVGSILQGDSVTPRVATAGVPGEVVLRGSNLGAAAGVSLGGTAATAVRAVTGTQLRVAYPALSEGTYPVTLAGGGSFAGELKVVAPTAFAAATLAYPASVGRATLVHSLTYDAERQAILVALWPSVSGGETLLRFVFSGGAWSAQAKVRLSNLLQVAVAPDGARLLALTGGTYQGSALLELDPVTLATTRTIPLALGGNYARTFVTPNDGTVLVTTRPPGSGYTPAYLYLPDRGRVVATSCSLFEAGAGLSADGSVAVLTGGLNGWSRYLLGGACFGGVGASSGYGTMSAPVVPAVSANGARSFSGVDVLDEALAPLGKAVSGVIGGISRDGTRAWVLSAWALHTHDLTAAPVSGVFPELGAAVPVEDPLPGTTGSSFQMAGTPDGATVFVASYGGVSVVPAPQ